MISAHRLSKRKADLRFKHNLHRRLKRAELNYCAIHKIVFVPFPKHLKKSTHKALYFLVSKYAYSIRTYSIKAIIKEAAGTSSSVYCCKTSIRF